MSVEIVDGDEVRPAIVGGQLPVVPATAHRQALQRRSTKVPSLDRRQVHWRVRPTCYPTSVRKTSIYLDDSDVERLRRLAAAEGRSQADIMRAALVAYERTRAGSRDFALEGSWAGDGSSVADVPEEDLLAGFGR